MFLEFTSAGQPVLVNANRIVLVHGHDNKDVCTIILGGNNRCPSMEVRGSYERIKQYINTQMKISS